MVINRIQENTSFIANIATKHLEKTQHSSKYNILDTSILRLTVSLKT
jgi:hemoglobin-like flavoprotein